MPFTPEQAKVKRDERRVAGLCTRCGGQRDSDAMMCADCRSEHRQRQAENRKRHGGNSPQSKRRRTERDDERRNAGLCRCGREPTEERRMCRKCLNQSKISSRRYRQRQKVEWMLEAVE